EGKFKFDEKINLPFFNGIVHRSDRNLNTNEYFIEFVNFDNIVAQFRRIRVQPESQGSSVLNISLTGHNKAEMVDYLNATSRILGEDVLRRKNLFATKTIQFIDSTLAAKSAELSNVQDELNEFRNNSSVVDLSEEGRDLSAK